MIRINLLEVQKPKGKRSSMPSMPTIEVGDMGSPRLKVLLAFRAGGGFQFLHLAPPGRGKEVD